MPQNHYHKPSHGSIRWAPVLLAAVVVWLTPWEATQAQTAGVTVAPLPTNDASTWLRTTEAGGTAQFTVKLDSQPEADVTIDVSSSDTMEGTVSTSSLTFTSSDWNTAQTVTVTGVNEGIRDGAQPYVIELSAAVSDDQNYAGMDPADVKMLNVNTVSAIGFSGIYYPGNISEDGGIRDVRCRMGNPPSSSVTFQVSFEEPTDEAVLSDESITIDPSAWVYGEWTSVRVTGVDDEEYDGDQSFTVVMLMQQPGPSTHYGAFYDGSSCSFSLINRDNEGSPVTVAPTAGLRTTEAGGTDTFTVELAVQPQADVTIGVSSSDTTEGTVSTDSLTFTPVNWATQTVTVTGQDDDVDDGHRGYAIRLAAAVSDDPIYTGRGPVDVAVSNTDNDNAGFTVDPTTGLTTTEAGGTATFTVELTSRPTADVTIGVSSSAISEGTVSPASLTFTASNWDTPQTVTVTGVDDDEYEGTSFYLIRLARAVSADLIYNRMNPPDVSVANTDDDNAPPPPPPSSPTVTVNDVITEEGDSLTFTVTLSAAVQGGLTVTPTYTDGTATAGTDYTQNTGALTFAGTANEQRTFTVATIEDEVVETDETFTVGLTVSGTTVLVTASATATGTIRNDDGAVTLPTPTVTVEDSDNAAVTVDPTTGLTTTEAGGTAQFIVKLDSRPEADVTIDVSSSDPEEGTVSPASLMFTASTWATAQMVTITGVDDDMDDGDQSYTIMLAPTVSADTNYSGMNPDDVGVTNMDDDVPADRIVLSVAPASVAEEAGAQSVAVTAAFPQGAARLLTDTLVTIAVTGKTASAEDFAAVADFPVIIPQLAVSGTATFVLTPILDVLREGDETVTVSGVAEGFTVTGTEVTIVDDVRRAKQTMTAVNRAIPPQVTQAMAASTVTAVQSRIEAGTACGGQGPSYQVASHQSLAGIMQTVSDGLRDGRLTVERLLGGSSFVLPLNTTDDGQKTGWRGLTIWGTGDYRNLGGGEAIDWDGELFGGHLGVDTCLNTDLLVGLSASVSQGAFDYAGLSGANPIGGSYTSRMTSVHPYVNWSSPEGLDLWATLGYGWGEIAIDEQGVPQRDSSDTTMQTAAVGANGRVLPVAGLLPGGTTSLRLKAEALLTTVKVEGNGGAIEPLALDARRFRLALEGSHERELASGAQLVPTVEVGVRHDGGDGIEGTGLEIGGGLRYVDQTRGLTVAGRGRALVTYGAQAYREWGANLFIHLDPGADSQGLSFTVLPTYGQTASGVSRLWEQGGNGVGAARQAAAGRLEALVGYGLPALEGKGLLTPYSAVTLESTGHQLRLGGLLGIGSSFNLSLEGTREVRRETPTVYGVRLQANRRF